MNLELAKLVYKQVTQFPESFNMREYYYEAECGTVACLAGHTLLLSGYTIKDFGLHSDGRRRCTITRPDGSSISDPALEAKNLLGISDLEYCGPFRDRPLFFDHENALDRFRDIIRRAERDS